MEVIRTTEYGSSVVVGEEVVLYTDQYTPQLGYSGVVGTTNDSGVELRSCISAIQPVEGLSHICEVS